MSLKAWLISTIFLTSFSSYAVADTVEVIDGGTRNEGKLEKIQAFPMGETRIFIERDEHRRISQIAIEQHANISTSGAALEVTDLLADLVEGDSTVDNPVVFVNQSISLFGDVNVSGIRFAGKSVRNERILKGIELKVIQNVPLVDKGQVWTTQTYATAYIHDYAGLQEVSLALAKGTQSGRPLGDVASFPGADRIYKKITMGGKIELVRGQLNQVGIESASLVPSFGHESCDSVL